MDKMSIHYLLLWALQEHAADYEVVSVNNLLIDGARKNDKRAAFLRFHCPDDWALNLAGDMALVDAYVAIRVPRELAEAWSKRNRPSPEGESKEEAVLSGSPPDPSPSAD